MRTAVYRYQGSRALGLKIVSGCAEIWLTHVTLLIPTFEPIL